MCWALAVVLHRARIPGSVGRKLSVLLAVEGITVRSGSAIAYSYQWRFSGVCFR
jgi:hypothetical protein